jgi:hypothetical protein
LLDEAANPSQQGDTTYLTEVQPYHDGTYAEAYFEPRHMFPPYVQVPTIQSQSFNASHMNKEDATNSRLRLRIQRRPERRILPLHIDKDHAGMLNRSCYMTLYTELIRHSISVHVFVHENSVGLISTEFCFRFFGKPVGVSKYKLLSGTQL